MTVLNGGGETAVGTQYRTEESKASNMPFMQKIMMSVMMPILMRKHKFDGHTIAEITDLDPTRCIAWTAYMPTETGKKLMQMHWEILLDEQNGTTKVTQCCQFDPPADSPFISMITDDLVANNKAETTLNLKRLKSILEA
jgi:hypothetical protein